MLTVQVIPTGEYKLYQLLREKIAHHATTFFWANGTKTRLKHNAGNGYIDIGNHNGILLARIRPANRTEFLIEKFVGRLVAWFPTEVAAINVQVVEENGTSKKKSKKK
jgi:hypothetical protein